MAKYTGPSNKLFRNFGVTDLSNRKLVSSLRQTASGQHGAARKKLSDYALHLNEKQKIRLTYLVSEKQFAKYYNKAARTKGVTGTVLLQLLESRLDNVVFRAGFATTRKQEPALALNLDAQINIAADSISDARHPIIFHASHLLISSYPTGIFSGSCCP